MEQNIYTKPGYFLIKMVFLAKMAWFYYQINLEQMAYLELISNIDFNQMIGISLWI